MLSLEWILAGAIVLALTAYTVLAGADFGGGVWDMLATGPRKHYQRQAIARAMGPVWEANHVWMIAVLVLLWSCFPPAFAAVATALNIPFTLVLVGIVLRGTAFVFRAHAARLVGFQRYLGVIFGAASLLTPLVLGMCVGALGSGQIRVQNGVLTSDYNYFSSWLFHPFPIMVGLTGIAVCAFLAAVYLTLETEKEPDLQEDFRKRALVAGVATAVLATITLPFVAQDAPMLWKHLLLGRSTPLVLLTMLLGLLAFLALWFRRYGVARLLSVGEVVSMVWGWALAQAPFIIIPDVTIFNSAANQAMLQAMIVTNIIGSLFLIPSMVLLIMVFKGRNPAAEGGFHGDPQEFSHED